MASRRLPQIVRWNRLRSDLESPLPATPTLTHRGHPRSSLSTVTWNPDQLRLTASADPLGHHPLYYSIEGDLVSIATRADVLAEGSLARLSKSAVVAHLCGQTESLDETFFLGVRALPPGTELRAERDAMTLPASAASRPWRRSLDGRRSSDEATAARELFDALLDAVGDSAEGADPIGVTLSSGIDSTTLAAVLKECRPEARRVAFVWTARSVPEADESGPAMRVANSLGMEIVEIALDEHPPLSGEGGLEPGGDRPTLPVYLEAWRETFRKARELGVRVLFTGHGGDLGFGAVFPFADLLLRGRWLRLASEVAAYRRRVSVDLPWLLRYRILGRAARWVWPLRSAVPPAWLGPTLRSQVPLFPRPESFMLPGDRERSDLLNGARRFLASAELNAEAAEFDVDLRHPWLDARLTELAERLPSHWTFRDGYSKALVRQAMRGRLPAEILERAEKIYPDAIFRLALRGPSRWKIDCLLENMISADLGFVEPTALRSAIDGYAAGRRGGGFWNALTLEAWLRGFDKAPSR